MKENDHDNYKDNCANELDIFSKSLKEKSLDQHEFTMSKFVFRLQLICNKW